MAVLVTGGAGYIGSHMVLTLRDAGRDVVVLDNLSTGFREALPESSPLVVGDVGDSELVAQILRQHKVEAVVHFAGSTVIPESLSDPQRYYVNNTANTAKLIACCVDGGVERFIFSSTAAVYGVPVSQAPVCEDAPLAPMTPYGRSKAMSEAMIRDVSATKPLRHVILRYFNVAGADPAGRAGQRTRGATHLIKVAAQTALGRRPHLDVFGTDHPTTDGSGVRDFVHVTDLAAAHLAALEHLERGGENLTLNCGYGRGYSVLDVIQAVAAATCRDVPWRAAPRRVGDASEVVADAGRIRESLGWRPKYSDLNIIVRTAIEFERGLVGI